MGGGNGQKAKMAREKNMVKMKAAGKGSQLDLNKKAMTIQLQRFEQSVMHRLDQLDARLDTLDGRLDQQSTMLAQILSLLQMQQPPPPDS